MKFTTTCLTLLAVASAFSIPVKEAEPLDWKKFNECMENRENEDCKSILDRGENLLSKCVDDIFKTCGTVTVVKDDLKDLGEECQTWKKSNCKTLLDAPLGESFEACKAIPTEFLDSKVNVFGINIRSILSVSISTMNFICSTDENGKLCPFVEFTNEKKQSLFDDLENQNEEEVEEKEAETEKLAIEAINKTCKSKACTDAFVDYYGNLINSIRDQKELFDTDSHFEQKLIQKRELILDPKLTDDEKLDQIMAYVKSDECIAQH